MSDHRLIAVVRATTLASNGASRDLPLSSDKRL
jgi:hypothetical protein